jgi:hypothetical protein
MDLLDTTFFQTSKNKNKEALLQTWLLIQGVKEFDLEIMASTLGAFCSLSFLQHKHHKSLVQKFSSKPNLDQAKFNNSQGLIAQKSFASIRVSCLASSCGCMVSSESSDGRHVGMCGRGISF